MKYKRKVFCITSVACAVSYILFLFCGCNIGSIGNGEKQTIHLAMIREVDSISSTFQKAIEAFNEESNSYIIVPVYYKDEASLQRALISGESIDLVDLFRLSTDLYVTKDVLVDLYTLLDQDTELSRTDFVAAFLEMAEQNGHLPYMSASFAARSFIAPKSVVGNIDHWSEQEFIEIATEAPDEYCIMDETSPENFMSIYLTYSIQNYVDISSGVVNLHQASFCNMLNFCKDAYRTSDPEKIPLLQYVSTIFGPMQYVTFLREQADEYALVGFPGADGNGALRYFAAEQLAISALSEQQEGAWAFLKFLVSSTDTNGIGFPVLQTNFDQTIQFAMEDEVDAQGNIIVPGMTEDERDSLIQWLDQAVGSGGTESTSEIIHIIVDEATAYISGDKPMDTVLTLMENRLAIYLAEVE